MVKHIIIWKLDESLSAEEKQKVKKEAKAALEALCGKVPGLVSLTLHTEILPSSTGDMMLDSTLESVSALDGYRSHPAHVAAADTYVRPFAAVRLCCETESDS